MSWLADTALATGALIALVLVLRRPVARWFGPGMAYALWALPLLRLALPPLILPAQPQSEVEVAALPAEDIMIVSGPIAPAEAASWPVAEIAAGLWLAGALAFLAWRWYSYVSMRRLLLGGAVPAGEANGVRLVESPATEAPVAFGVRDKVIALPLGFMNRPDIKGRDLAIAHELEHHAGRDLAVNLAMQPLLALHWFNPLAWLGWRAMRRDQEAACDARVLAGADNATRAAYARLIAGFACSPRLALAAPMACPMLGEKSIIHRLRSLTMTDPSPRRSRLGRFMLGAGILALPLTATITYAASEPGPPAPPEAPAAPEAPKALTTHKHVMVIKDKDGKDDWGERKIVIVDNPAGSTVDDPNLHTRVIKRDGKTIVLKTVEPVSEAEAEERVAEAIASMAEAEEAREEALEARSEAIEARVEAEVARGLAEAHRELAIAASQECKAKHTARAHAESTEDGQRHVTSLAICVGKEARAEALSGLREAREEISRDKDIPAKVRDSVLRQLDAEIRRLSKEA